MRKEKIATSIGVGIVFLLFFIFMLLQHANVFMYHDDFDYGSLSYIYNEEGVTGTNYTFGQLFHYLYMHWKVWGGRVLSFLIQILLLKSKNLIVIRLFQSIIITGIFYLIWKLNSDCSNRTKLITAVSVCFLFGVFPLECYRYGFYWFSASSSYVWPIFYYLAGAFLLWNILNNYQEKQWKLIIPCILLNFMAGFSMEQISVAVPITIICIIAYTFYITRNKKALFYGITVWMFTIVGSLFVILAPGNNARRISGLYDTYYDLNFIEQIVRSTYNALVMVFSNSNRFFICLYCISSLILSIPNLKNNKITDKIICGINFVLTIIIFTFSYINSFSVLFCILTLCYCVISFIVFSNFLVKGYKKYDILILFILIGGYFTQISMAISPIYVSRNAIPFIMISFLVIIRSLVYLADQYSALLIRKISYILLLFVIVVSGQRLLGIYKGYYKNASALSYNIEQIKIVKKLSSEEKLNNTVVLMNVPDALYAGSLIHEYPHLLHSMEKFYDVPTDLLVSYVDYNKDILGKEVLSEELKNLPIISKGTLGNIENINNKPLGNVVKVSINEPILLSGWGINGSQYIGKTYIKLGDAYFLCSKQERSDVAETFKNPNYLHSGFKCNILSGLNQKGIYPVSIVGIDDINNIAYEFKSNIELIVE